MFRSFLRGSRGVAICTLALAFLTTPLLAQTSSLSGVVTDPQGAVVPGAEVSIVSSTGSRRMVVTDDQGRYVFPQVTPGTYTIQVALPGFKTTTIPDVSLEVDNPVQANIQLELGEVTEIVTVTSDSVSLVNKIDATIGNTFNEEQIFDLPLNYRNVVNLLTLQPGVTAQGEVSGARRDQSNLMLDGIDVNDQEQAGSQPGLDSAQPGSPREFVPVLRATTASVQEFQVTVANPSASQGRSAAAQVSLVTRAGTNDWHGSAYYAYRGRNTTANTFFNNRVVNTGNPKCASGEDCALERPDLYRNVYGASVGGPIKSDRAFFFFNYEGRIDRSQQSVIQTVPLPHMGDGLVKYDSASTGERITLSQADIAAAYPTTGGVNPLVLAVLKDAAARYPANDNGRGDQINTDGFRFNAPTPLRQNTWIAKIDVNLTDTQTMFVRGNYQWDTQGTAPRFPDTASPAIWSHPIGMAVGHTWSASPTITNNFRYGLTRQAFTQLGDSKENYIRWRAVYFPVRAIRDTDRVTPMHNFTNDTSWIRGNHTVQFGINFRFVDNTRRAFGNAYDDATSNGFFYPPGTIADAIGDVSGGSETSLVHGMAAVLGRFPQYSARFTFGPDGDLLPSGSPAARNFATEEYDVYIEDNWALSPTLSVNFGLRYGINTPVNETTGFQVTPTESLGLYLQERLATADQGGALNRLITIDTAGPFYGKRGYYDIDKNNFMPRISAAWSPQFEGGFLGKLFGTNRETVFRGGWAMLYDRVGSALAVQFDRRNTLGFTSNTTISANTYNVTDNLAPLFTGFDMNIRGLPGIVVPERVDFPLEKPPTGSRRIESALDDSFETPVNYSWNFSIGRELPGGLFIEGSYVGRRARNLFATQDIMHPNNIRDPVSGMDFYEAARILMEHREVNTPITGIAPIPFFENMFPNVSSSGRWFIDPSLSPTHNAYLWAARDGHDVVDWTFFQDQWNNLGTIPNMFFHPQYAAFMTFGSIASSDYHGLTISARERFSDSLSIDFNYTWSKSMDNASGLQNSSFTGSAALIKNPINPEFERGRSDFHTQHIINTNWLWQMPYGQGRRFGADAHPVVDAILGGWALNGIVRWNSGRPIGGPFESGRWNTNWQISNSAIRYRDPNPDPHKGGDQPNFWADPQFAYNSFRDTFAGEVGDRNVFTRSDYFVLDLGLFKSFGMPYAEGHELTFRWEVFNVTNTQMLSGPSTNGMGVDPHISQMRPNFGQITSIQGEPRVMQFGLVYEF